jgi:hypothetical protein
MVMLLPLSACALFLFRAKTAYPRDVAAGAAIQATPEPLDPLDLVRLWP